MKQQRNTKQRQLVLDAVQARCGSATRSHPTADQIYLDVRAIDDKISRGTVYRNLNFWAEQSKILCVKSEKAERYDCRLNLHYHLLCTGCGVVLDAPAEYLAELDRDVAEATGFSICRHRTVFEGLCTECQQKRE